MLITIYGREMCIYCKKAKKLAKKLALTNKIDLYKYIDINKEKLSKQDLSNKIGKTITTVPQIFIGNEHIGGYIDFYNYCQDNSLI